MTSPCDKTHGLACTVVCCHNDTGAGFVILIKKNLPVIFVDFLIAVFISFNLVGFLNHDRSKR